MLDTPDVINSALEFGGSLAIWWNVLVLHQHKRVAGVSKLSVGFFAVWGFWNLYYYPHLGQWWSMAAASMMVVATVVWFGQMWYYGRGEK